MTELLKRYQILILVSLIIVILDQLTKWLILDNMLLYESIPVIPNLFNLTHIHNTGGAFGFMADQHPLIRQFLFHGVSMVSLAIIVYFYHKSPVEYPFLLTALSLIFGGAVGNLIDRFRLGEVVDFLDVYIGTWHWPAFNVADSAVSVGVTILMYYMIFKKVP
ncbi:MAG: signal peptidase II [Candidatus Magnetomorum sp.]|nr:signal peptidase II [Candidatus Magnetomorum sp.]